MECLQYYLGHGTHRGMFTILPRKWDSSWSVYNITAEVELIMECLQYYLGSGTNRGVFTILPRKWNLSWNVYNIT